MRKKDAFVAKIASMRLTKTVVAIFALAERLPSSATLVVDKCPLQGVQGQRVEPLRRAVQRHKHTEAQVRMT